MTRETLLLLAADAMLVVHALFVAFVVLGLVLIIAGGLRRWQWVHNRWFRVIHLLAIAIVVLQSWLGIVCPLTTWEMSLRRAAGQSTYDGTFISHWVGQLLYYQAPPWAFIAAYTVFGALVLLSWWLVPPGFRRRA